MWAATASTARPINGQRCPGYGNWEGMQDTDLGDRIGMLLNLDQGSMTAWKNGEKPG